MRATAGPSRAVLGPVGSRLVAVIAFWWEDGRGPGCAWVVGTHLSGPDRTPLAVQNLRSLVARLHGGFTDRDLDAWSEVFDEDVELVVDGAAFRGVAAARAYVTAVFREFPGLRIHGARIVAESGDTIVVEHQILNGDPSLGAAAPAGLGCARSTRARRARRRLHELLRARGRRSRGRGKRAMAGRGLKLAEEQAALRHRGDAGARGVSEDELFRRSTRKVGGSWGPILRP